MYFTNNGTDLYKGDIQIGDREATIEEVKAYEDKKDLAIKINEAKEYLANTDYKDLPRYVPKADEDIETIYRLRDEAREFIRTNDVPNP